MGLGVVLLGVFASPAAAVRTVTLETDNNTTGSVPGELRYEISQAVPGELVQIAPGVDPQLSPFLLVGGGQILIDDDVIIAGQGADQTTISVVFTSRIFEIFSMSSQADVTIRDVALAGGRAPDGAGGSGAVGSSGGAIVNSEDLTLDRVAFVSNSAGNGGSGTVGATSNPGGTGGTGGGGGFGGAILNTVGGDVTIMNSTFEDNTAGDGGNGGKGGNSSGGMISIAGNGGPGGVGRDGGAISNAGAMTVINSTFFSNESGRGGNGGNKGDVGDLGVGGNGGPGGDGAAIHQAGAGSLTLSNVTIAGNEAQPGGSPGTGAFGSPTAGAGGTGGGTFFNTGPSSIVVANTLYSLNTGTTGANCAGPGTVTVQGANLAFPAGSGCPGSFSSGNPQLGALVNNGGPTRTMALGGGSAAIDAAGPIGQATDQRGIARPQGARCDIGAFELQQATIPGSTCAGPPAVTPTLPTTSSALPPAKKCKKGRKLKKGRCVKKRKRRK